MDPYFFTILDIMRNFYIEGKQIDDDDKNLLSAMNHSIEFQ